MHISLIYYCEGKVPDEVLNYIHKTGLVSCGYRFQIMAMLGTKLETQFTKIITPCFLPWKSLQSSRKDKYITMNYPIKHTMRKTTK